MGGVSERTGNHVFLHNKFFMTNTAPHLISLIIIENDDDERQFMEEGFLATGKFRLLAMLRNGDQLIQWIESQPRELPDLILSDLNMPGKNGYDIIDFAGKLKNPVPVVITSTSTTPTIIRKCLEAGAAEYIVKPDTFIEYQPFAERLYEVVLEHGLKK